jgi:UDP-N-acetylmuramoylalanine--D-glutamate ligase
MRNLDGARVVVAGMARSGRAAVELLRARGARVRATDLRPAADLPVEFVLQSAAAFADADLIVLSPGVPFHLPLLEEPRRRGVPVIGDVELAGWFLEGPVLGITGSNGKTTTTAMAGHLLQASGVACQVGGNIGTPVCSLVVSSRPDQWNVLELSSFQLEATESFRARIGAVLNLTPDHLDRHGSMERYAAAKRRLVELQQAGDHAVLNAADARVAAFAAHTRAEVHWFNAPQGAHAAGGNLYLDGAPLLPAAEIPLPGAHNLENTMAAALCAHLAGASRSGIAAGIRTFRAVEHRLEFVRETGGVRYYNDSKATNVDAALKAIDAFPGGLWIILGGKDKDSDYRPLAAPLRAKARAALLIGAAAPKIEAHLGGAVEVIRAGTLARALAEAGRRARPGDVVLLAPACASFDQFDNFEHRGRVFKQLVEEAPWRSA